MISRKREGGSSFPLTAFFHLFYDVDADVLLLFDSCQAVPQAFDSKGKGVVSAITATGFEPSIIGTAAEVGSHSFTHALIQVLGVLSMPRETSPQSAQAPATDVLLHSLLITELKKFNISLDKRKDGSFKRDASGHHLVEPFRRRTPIYHWLSRNRPHRQILLSPLTKIRDAAVPASMQQQPVCSTEVPEVLIAIRLAPDSLDDMDIEAWTKWVLSLPGNPTDVSFKGRTVNIEGFYQSLSSLLILRMPTETWTSLRKFRAMTFIGYVTSENLANVVNERVDHRIRAGSTASAGESASEDSAMQGNEDVDSYALNYGFQGDRGLAST